MCSAGLGGNKARPPLYLGVKLNRRLALELVSGKVGVVRAGDVVLRHGLLHLWLVRYGVLVRKGVVVLVHHVARETLEREAPLGAQRRIGLVSLWNFINIYWFWFIYLFFLFFFSFLPGKIISKLDASLFFQFSITEKVNSGSAWKLMNSFEGKKTSFALVFRVLGVFENN